MDPELRIAFAVNRYLPSTGGTELHVRRLADYLTGAGHRVTVLTHDLDNGEPLEEVIDGVRVLRFLPLVPTTHFMASPSLGHHLATHQDDYDLVHAHGYHDTPALMAALTWHGPLVFTPHYHGSSDSRLRSALHVPYRAVGRRIVRRADAVVCVTDAERRRLGDRFPGALPKSTVISNGVDVERFTTAAVLPAEPDGRRRIVCAGRLDAYKRVDRVIDAMTLLSDRFVLEICGDGPARTELERRVAALDLGGSVRIRGRVTDSELASQIRSAAVLVSMSEQEAQGIVLLEATAAGVPSVASGIPAHADVRRQTEGAVDLVPERVTTADLAAAIRRAADRPAPDQFVPSWSEVGLQTEMLYTRVLGADQKVSSNRGEAPVGGCSAAA
jgi:glycosyltransferase involved in cell wall biosynthesis